MSAFLAVADVLILRGSYEDALVVPGGIRKQLYSADRNFAETCNRLLGIGRSFRKHRAQQNPEIADKHTEAGEHEELGQLSARHVAFVGRANRKLFLP